MIALLRWKLVKATWLMAGITYAAAAYLHTMPRFYG
jgi:hypothetical protein